MTIVDKIGFLESEMSYVEISFSLSHYKIEFFFLIELAVYNTVCHLRV